MFIPKILKVRVRYKQVWNRDTRTYDPIDKSEKNPLAYITYLNEKGKLMKEKSWSTWGNDYIGEFKNVPSSGFELEKTVTRSREWFGTGKTLFRIIHPEGFQFEITANNLFEILQDVGVAKGGILNGEFVIAYDGANMALIPVTSSLFLEYAISTIGIEDGGIKPSELIPGKIYKNRRGVELVYLGRYYFARSKEDAVRTSSYSYPWSHNSERKADIHIEIGREYVFCKIESYKKSYTKDEFQRFDIETLCTPKMITQSGKVEDFLSEKNFIKVQKGLWGSDKCKMTPYSDEDKENLKKEICDYYTNYYSKNRKYQIMQVYLKEKKK